MYKIILFLCLSISNVTVAQTATEYFEQSKSAFEKKDLNLAEHLITKAISEDSSNIQFYSLKGIILDELNLFQEELEIYNKAISLFPEESFLYSKRGVLLMELKESDYAIQDFSLAMRYASDDTLKNHFLINRAAAKIRKRDFEGSYQDLLKAYKFDSLDMSILTNLGNVCGEIGKPEESLKYLQKAIQIDSSYYYAYGNIGFIYQGIGQHEKAIQYFDIVLKHNPDEALGYSNRSFSKLKLGNLDGAMSDIEKSIQLYPANSYAYRTRALINIEYGKIDLACEDLQISADKGFTKIYGNEVITLQQKYCKK